MCRTKKGGPRWDRPRSCDSVLEPGVPKAHHGVGGWLGNLGWLASVDHKWRRASNLPVPGLCPKGMLNWCADATREQQDGCEADGFPSDLYA